MKEIVLTVLEGESLEECLWRLGSLKKSGKTDVTWDQIASFLNTEFDQMYGESAYRKRFKRLVKAASARPLEAIYESDYREATKLSMRELEKQRIRIREERNLYNKNLRTEAQQEALFAELKDAIKQIEPMEIHPVENKYGDRVILAMLSDIHFGLNFESYYENYSPEIAASRVMKYARKLCDLGRREEISKIYVNIMGDLISGNIHPTIRLENRGNIISQVTGVAELISYFLATLSQTYSEIIVTNISGNHSRIESNPDNALRSERLDEIIPWYCKAKLEKIDSITFENPTVDTTIDLKTIFGKTYVAVHGDFDSDLKTSAVRISQLINKKVDFLLAGHMHVADMRFEDTALIRNGAVVTGGDDYTTKKRLFAPAAQVALICSEKGVDSIHPFVLS